MRKRFAEYLAAYDGTRDWASIRPLFDEVFDDGCVFVTAEGDMTKAQWGEMAEKNVGLGVTLSDVEVSEESNDTLLYQVTMHLADGTSVSPTARATINEGQIVRIEPLDPEAYSRLVQQSQ